jgi:SSS family transporter
VRVSSLTWPDYAVLVASLLVLVVIGIVLTRQQRDTRDFFLARRRVPWWAACLSFLATEVSAVTIISVPATAYRENLEYFQFFVGSSLAKLAVAFLFIPAFYRHDVTTIYEFLRHRFGHASQVTGSIFFFVTRLIGSAVRLTVPAIAVSVLLDWPLVPTIVVFVVVSIVYIAAGGVKAVVWTNVFQASMFLLAGVATLIFLLLQIDGGFAAIERMAGAAGRLNVVNWGPAIGAPDFWRRVLTEPNIVWVAVLNGFIGSMAAFGTDHDLMQRLLTVDTRRQSQKTLVLTVVGTFVTLVIFLGLGIALYTFYAQHPALPVSRPDEILPHFVQQMMPPVLRGLMLSAIVLASIDSPLASLSASFVTDIYRPLLVRGRTEGHYLWVSRISVVVFGAVLAVLAYGFSFFDQFLWLVFKIAGVTFGSLLGVFLLGLLTRRPISDSANVVAMVTMAFVNLILLVLSEQQALGVVLRALGWDGAPDSMAWSWLVIVGTAGTMLIALALSAAGRGRSRSDRGLSGRTA